MCKPRLVRPAAPLTNQLTDYKELLAFCKPLPTNKDVVPSQYELESLDVTTASEISPQKKSNKIKIQKILIQKKKIQKTVIQPDHKVVKCGQYEENVLQCDQELGQDDQGVPRDHLTGFLPSVKGGFVRDIPAVLWKTPRFFSQSWLCGRNKPSAACTIISLLMAENMYRQQVLLPTVKENAKMVHVDVHETGGTTSFECPKRLLNALSNAIIDGNNIYERTHKTHSQNKHTFTIPEAIRATNGIWREVTFSRGNGPFNVNVASYLERAINSPLTTQLDQMFFLILLFERCVLVVYQRCNHTIGIIDSHTHFERGSLIACTSADKLAEFGTLLARTFFPESCVIPDSIQEFEVSLIQFTGPMHPTDCQQQPQPLILVDDKKSQIFPPAVKMKKHKTAVAPYTVARETLNIHYHVIREVLSPTLIVPDMSSTDLE